MTEIPKEVNAASKMGSTSDLFQNERLQNLPKLSDFDPTKDTNKIVPPYVHADTPAGVENAERGSQPRWKQAENAPKDLAQTLKELQINMRDTQDGLKEYLDKTDTRLYDLEMSRRGLLTNPYKSLTASSGMALFRVNPKLASLQVTGVAALQGYDDYKNLLDSKTALGKTKYAVGLLADTAFAAGSIGFLMESVPLKYKAPLLIGGILVRGALDFIPNRK